MAAEGYRNAPRIRWKPFEEEAVAKVAARWIQSGRKAYRNSIAVMVLEAQKEALTDTSRHKTMLTAPSRERMRMLIDAELFKLKQKAEAVAKRVEKENVAPPVSESVKEAAEEQKHATQEPEAGVKGGAPEEGHGLGEPVLSAVVLGDALVVIGETLGKAFGEALGLALRGALSSNQTAPVTTPVSTPVRAAERTPAPPGSALDKVLGRDTRPTPPATQPKVAVIGLMAQQTQYVSERHPGIQFEFLSSTVEPQKISTITAAADATFVMSSFIGSRVDPHVKSKSVVRVNGGLSDLSRLLMQRFPARETATAE